MTNKSCYVATIKLPVPEDLQDWHNKIFIIYRQTFKHDNNRRYSSLRRHFGMCARHKGTGFGGNKVAFWFRQKNRLRSLWCLGCRKTAKGKKHLERKDLMRKRRDPHDSPWAWRQEQGYVKAPLFVGHAGIWIVQAGVAWCSKRYQWCLRYRFRYRGQDKDHIAW